VAVKVVLTLRITLLAVPVVDIYLPSLSSFYVFIYAVDVSMPIATALTLTALEYTTSICPAANAIPDLSNTPLGNNSTSYSMYSLFTGVPALATAILTDTAAFPLLHIEQVTIEKVLVGQV
jgi:hypothetical protein